MVNRTLSEAAAQAVPTILPSSMPATLAKLFIYRRVLVSAPGRPQVSLFNGLVCQTCLTGCIGPKSEFDALTNFNEAWLHLRSGEQSARICVRVGRATD